MKRAIIALVLSVTVLCTAVWELWYVGKQVNTYTARIEAVDALVLGDDICHAAEHCRSVERDWEQAVKRLNVLLIHDYADRVGYNIAKMRVNLEHGNRALYFTESIQAKKELASIKGSEYPLFENIM